MANVSPPLHITFGVELEFIYAVRKQVIRDALIAVGESPNLVDQKPSEICDQYLLSKLTRCIPGGIRQINELGKVGIAEDSEADYNFWNLGTDISVGCTFDEMITEMDGADTEKELDINWYWRGTELVSQTLYTADEGTWLPMLQQIQMELVPNSDGGGFATSVTNSGLHVHIGIVPEKAVASEGSAPQPSTSQGLTLGLVQNILIMWAAFEHEIDTFHPIRRRGNNCDYAKSLCRNYLRHLPYWDPVNYAKTIYRLQDERDLVTLVFGRAVLEQKYHKIGISPARLNKELTLEFRQHAGSLDAWEIYWWVKFIEAFVTTVHRWTEESEFKFQKVEDFQFHQSILEIIELDSDGQDFFLAKQVEYYV